MTLRCGAILRRQQQRQRNHNQQYFFNNYLHSLQRNNKINNDITTTTRRHHSFAVCCDTVTTTARLSTSSRNSKQNLLFTWFRWWCQRGNQTALTKRKLGEYRQERANMAFQWGYTHENGPEQWSKHYHCGRNQSPIDIQHSSTIFTSKLSDLPLKINYEKCFSTLNNTGATWKLTPENNNSHNHNSSSNSDSGNGGAAASAPEMSISGGPLGDHKYRLLQAHAHWPAEHLVDGKQCELEIHFVHQNTKYASGDEALRHRDGLAVIGIMYSSKANSRRQEDMRDLLGELVEMCADIRFRDDVRDFSDEPLDWQAFLPDDLTSYYTYSGSLTTPPLNECVTWIVMREMCRVDDAQLRSLRQLCALSRSDAEATGCITTTSVGSNNISRFTNGTTTTESESGSESGGNNNNKNSDTDITGKNTKAAAALEPHLLKVTNRPVQPVNQRNVYRSWN